MNDAPQRIEVEIEVPGTPEEIWDAIATGPGISAWFVPAEVEEHEGGTVAFDFGGGLEGTGVVTDWDPPRRIAYEEDWQPFEGQPGARLATEFLVEARGGGTCVVRLVSSVFASGADWERELENTADGWRLYLDNLRLYRTHFSGQRCAWVTATGHVDAPHDEGWATLTAALRLDGAAEGERVAATGDAPPLAGIVERVSSSERHRELALRTDEPAPGLGAVLAYAWQEQTYARVHLYLFGDDAAAVAAREEPAWRAWMTEHLAAVR